MNPTPLPPRWVVYARADIGLRELPGAPTAPRIQAWLQRLGAWWRDDETPWCGTAVAAWMLADNIAPPKAWYRAKAWLEWGRPLTEPQLGCVVVFQRDGGGHVGLVVGKDAKGRLMVLGGNQGNSVSVAPFDMARVLGYRWPEGTAQVATGGPLPVLTAAAVSSSNEA